ncbi:hydrogenase maturation nickel metallochaperone HypA [Chloroflexota bacterium]
MHELSLVQDILQASLDEAGKAGNKRIRQIHARVRESGYPMEANSLQALLETIAKGTVAEGAEMEIELIPPTLRCKECDFNFLYQANTLVCPQCRSSKLEELENEEIDLECSFED